MHQAEFFTALMAIDGKNIYFPFFYFFSNRSGFSKPVQPQVPPLAQYPGVQPQYSGAYGNPYTGAPPPPYAATQQQQYPGATPQVAAPVVSPFPPPPHLRQYYIIQSQLSNLVLDIEEGCRNPGTRVVTWYMKAGDPKNQIFYEDSGTGTIRAKLNDLCFEIIGRLYMPHCQLSV